METFIYYCENEAGVEMTFISKALIDIGVTVFDDGGNPFTIVDLDLRTHISTRDDVIERALERLMY